MRALALAVLLAACAPPSSHATHAGPSGDGREWHSCWGYSREPFYCEEGYACTRHGCEWCGAGGVRTRCTWGND